MPLKLWNISIEEQYATYVYTYCNLICNYTSMLYLKKCFAYCVFMELCFIWPEFVTCYTINDNT